MTQASTEEESNQQVQFEQVQQYQQQIQQLSQEKMVLDLKSKTLEQQYLEVVPLLEQKCKQQERTIKQQQQSIIVLKEKHNHDSKTEDELNKELNKLIEAKTALHTSYNQLNTQINSIAKYLSSLSILGASEGLYCLFPPLLTPLASPPTSPAARFSLVTSLLSSYVHVALYC